MDDQSKIPMTPFDTLISTPGLRMMKLMIPYLPPSNQRMLAVYVKFYGITTDVFFFFRIFAQIYIAVLLKRKCLRHLTFWKNFAHS